VLWGKEGDIEAYKKYGKGNKMTLVWKMKSLKKLLWFVVNEGL
jgi:hypothetical protein